MKRHYWSVLLWVIGAAGFSCGAEVKSTYAVSEVLGVSSPVAFDCRLAGYPYGDNVRFHVRVRGVVRNPQVPVDEAAEYLRERLKNADQIVLKKIQFRNYFRVTADISVDGRDLEQELIAQHLAAAEQPLTVKPSEAVAVQTPSQPVPRRYQPPVPESQPVAAQSQGRVVTLESLLDTEVDLSAINEDTTFQDALKIISDSVRPRVPFVILWNDLETNALIDKDMPIGAGGFGVLKLKYALKIILHSVSRTAQMKLHMAMEGGVVTIGTQRGLLQKSRVQSYSVADIVSAPFTEDTTNNQQGNQGGY